jgi:uncharacterized protein DUF6941
MSEPPIPTLLAMLLCDQIITEAGTGKKSLIGIFDSIHPSELPVILPAMWIYARLSDAEGKYVFKAEMMHLEEDKVVGTAETNEVNAVERLGFVDLTLKLPGVPFEKYGKYEFQLYANGIYIGRSTLTVSKAPKAELR